jgi:hypothetical protein
MVKYSNTPAAPAGQKDEQRPNKGVRFENQNILYLHQTREFDQIWSWISSDVFVDVISDVFVDVLSGRVTTTGDTAQKDRNFKIHIIEILPFTIIIHRLQYTISLIYHCYYRHISSPSWNSKSRP